MTLALPLLLVSIATSPAAPVQDQPVTLTASSQSAGVAYSWDLDGDGTFADASGASIVQTLPAGVSTVAVRATDPQGHTSTETRSLTTTSDHEPPMIKISMSTLLEVHKTSLLYVEGRKYDGQITKIEVDTDGDGGYDVDAPISRYGETNATWVPVSFDSAGDRVLHARVTDDQGETVAATIAVHVVDSPPSANVVVYDGDSFDRAPVAGQPATILVASSRAAAKYEFDLDGDGTYEVDNGTSEKAQTTFTVGSHVIGVRITDTEGGVIEPRITTFVFQPSDAFGDKAYAHHFETSASVGEPIDLTISLSPEDRVYQVEWDADGDGAFDDGTSTSPGGLGPNAGDAHNTYTYTAPGVYEQRVRVSRDGLPTRVFTSTIFVASAPTDRTPAYLSLGMFRARGTILVSSVSSSVFGEPAVTLDMDGDGAFDDTPASSFEFPWTFTAPVTIAAKATDPATGANVTATVEAKPLGHDATPAVTLDVSGEAGDLLTATLDVDDAAGAQCCSAAWDTDGDGAYDDGEGAFPATTATAGEHTIGVKVTDSAGRGAFVRKTFTVPAQSSAQPSAQPAPRKPSLKLTTRVKSVRLSRLLSHGLTVTPGCAQACRASVVVSADKPIVHSAAARNLKELGKSSGNGRTITVKLNAKARKALKKAKRVKLRVTVVATGSGGTASEATKRFTVKR